MLMLQDMVSLLMSKDAPKAASSISPALKEMTSAGTLGFDRNPPAIVERAESDKARTQADGLNFQSINATADKLLSSATKLETEVTKETRYWEQILSVTERGWNITKVRGSAHTLGVRYACSEGMRSCLHRATRTNQQCKPARSIKLQVKHRSDQAKMEVSHSTMDHIAQGTVYASASLKLGMLSRAQLYPNWLKQKTTRWSSWLIKPETPCSTRNCSIIYPEKRGIFSLWV